MLVGGDGHCGPSTLLTTSITSPVWLSAVLSAPVHPLFGDQRR